MQRAQSRPDREPSRRSTSRPRRPEAGRRIAPLFTVCAALLAAGVVTTLPAPSHATDATLRMAFSNIVNGPLDAVVSPYTGGHILVTNMRDISDSAGVRVTYALPGYVWLFGLEFGGGALRTVTGVLETAPGVLLFPFDQDMDELFDPVESASAIVAEWENPLAENEEWYVRWNPVATFFSIPIRFGLNYTRADY